MKASTIFSHPVQQDQFYTWDPKTSSYVSVSVVPPQANQAQVNLPKANHKSPLRYKLDRTSKLSLLIAIGIVILSSTSGYRNGYPEGVVYAVLHAPMSVFDGYAKLLDHASRMTWLGFDPSHLDIPVSSVEPTVTVNPYPDTTIVNPSTQGRRPLIIPPTPPEKSAKGH